MGRLVGPGAGMDDSKKTNLAPTAIRNPDFELVAFSLHRLQTITITVSNKEICNPQTMLSQSYILYSSKYHLSPRPPFNFIVL
jgi:hypothetical protein